MTFAEKVKQVRIILMLSQQEMAEKLGVVFETVNRWENERCRPSFKAQRAFSRLCKENNIDLD